MKIVFGAQTRSGSEFLIKLTRALLTKLPEPYSVVSPGRVEHMLKENNWRLRELHRQKCGWQYFKEYSISSAKIEDPCIDYFGCSVAEMFPQTKWLTTVRQIEEIIISHYNIISWGKSEEHVIQSFRSGINLFEELADQNRLYVLNIDRPARFRIERLSEFLECEVTEKANWIANNWPKVNSLEYQKDKFGEPVLKREKPPNLKSLRKRHPWINEVERRYLRVWERCS